MIETARGEAVGDRPQAARAVYATLLEGTLAPHDRQSALAGEVNSLAYLDRPREAYRVVGAAPITSAELGLRAGDDLALPIANRTTANTLGARVALRRADGVTLEGSTYAERFSDGNRRHGADVALAIAAFPAAGVGFAIRRRTFSDRSAGSPGYFDPAHYAEQDALVTLRRRVQAWRVDASAGLGHRSEAGRGGTPFAYALSAGGPLRGCLRELALDDQSSLASASGYRRNAASLAFSCAW